MHKSFKTLLVLGLAACAGGGEPTPEPGAAGGPDAGEAQAEKPAVPQVTGKEPSLLIVTMDTTRVDRLGAYGYDLAVTPNVDQTAAEGVRFDRAYSVVPLTTPAHSSMMTGLYPTRHGIHTNGDAILSEEYDTLAEVLQARGYKTAGSVSAFVTTRIWNLDQGFDSYFDNVAATKDSRDDRWGRERRAGAVVDDLEGWLKEKPAGAPFFAWAHFYDPHDPYDPPEPWDTDERVKDRPYDGEISYMDAQIGRLRKLAEEASGEGGLAIILVADHGEGMGEHGEQLHGMYVWDSTMRIPFIMKPAKPLSQTQAVDSVAVSNVDVMPTALGLLGIESPEGIDGRDLSGFAQEQAVEREPVYLEAETAYARFGFHPEWAAAEGDWKLMATPNPRLFNVKDDPKELTNLYGTDEELQKRLHGFVDGIQAARSQAEDFSASPEMIEQLAALGYVTGEDAGPMDLSGTLDVKDQAKLIARIERAGRLARNPRRIKEAEKALRTILSEHPEMGEMRMNLARVLQRQRKLEDAEALLREGMELQPQSTLLKTSLASVLSRQGRVQEAYDLTKVIHEQVPGDDLARYAMLRYLRMLDRQPEAMALGNGWLQGSPGNNGLQALVGEMEALIGDRAKGVRLLESSLDDDIPRANVHRTLALLAYAGGSYEAATEHLEKEALWFPTNPQVRLELGNSLMKLERWDDGAAEFAVLTKMEPNAPSPRRLWAQAIFNAGDYPGAAEVLAPALEQFPDNPDVLLLQANILDKLGKAEEAQAVFAEATALHEARVAAARAERGELPGMDPYVEKDELPGIDEL